MYFAANVNDWYSLARQFDRSLKNGRLILISKTFMANNWGIVHCCHDSGAKILPPLEVVLTSTSGVIQDSVYMDQYQWGIVDGNARLYGKVGPLLDEMNSKESGIEPQCLGVGLYSIMKRSSGIFSSSSTLSSTKGSIPSKASSTKSSLFGTLFGNIS